MTWGGGKSKYIIYIMMGKKIRSKIFWEKKVKYQVKKCEKSPHMLGQKWPWIIKKSRKYQVEKCEKSTNIRSKNVMEKK